MSSTIKVNNIQNLAGDDSGIDLSTNDQIILKTANTTAITVDSSQVATFAGNLAVTGATTLSSSLAMTSDDPTITMTDTSGTNDIGTIQATSGALIFTARDGSADGEILFKKFDGTTTDESVRIDSSGNLLVGATTARTGTNTLSLEGGNSLIWFQKQNTDLQTQVIFNRNTQGTSSVAGSIQTTGTTVSYNTSSDYRLKESVSYDFDATTRLKQLKPCRFNWIQDETDTTVDGFLAHEVQSVVPEAISGTHNEVDDDGNPVMQGIDQSKIVPLLVKTIQELEARITALEGK